MEYVPSEQQEQLWFISWVEYLRQEHGMQIQVMRDGFNGVYFWWLQYKPNAVPLVLEPALNYGDLLGNSTCYGIWLAISVRCFSCFATWKGKSNSNCKNIVAIFFGLVLYEPRTNLCNRTIYIYIYDLAMHFSYHFSHEARHQCGSLRSLSPPCLTDLPPSRGPLRRRRIRIREGAGVAAAQHLSSKL